MQLSGEIAKVSLPNILQLVKTGAFTGKLSLVEGVKHAIILVKEGLPIHAELEGESGVDPLYELFLWQSGTFSFSEEKVRESKRTIPKESEEFSIQELIKDGMLYKKQTALLKDMSVTPQTVLKATGSGVSAAKMIEGSHNIGYLDGKKTLFDALKERGLSRREFVRTVSHWLENGLAEFVENQSNQDNSEISLPTWVVARLKQDNSDLTQAIIDMVIWVDRVKCWMYQADAEFYETRKDLAIISDALGNEEEEESSEDNLFAPPAPPEQELNSHSEKKFDSMLTGTPSSIAKPDTTSQFRLSSSFVGGAGGKLSFLQKENLQGYSQLDGMGISNPVDSKKKDQKGGNASTDESK